MRDDAVRLRRHLLGDDHPHAEIVVAVGVVHAASYEPTIVA
jgi:hypothetical protein